MSDMIIQHTCYTDAINTTQTYYINMLYSKCND